MKYFFSAVLCFTMAGSSFAQLPHVSSGTIKRYANFPSTFVTARNVDVWLPANYSAKKKYAVLYMHDGQMLFDSTATWNKTEWGVDETVGKMIAEKKIRDCIVVAIWNLPASRFADYFPQKIIDSIPWATRNIILEKQIKGLPQADRYLKFIVAELKPFIDRQFSTRKNVKNTFIMGSSMGGLISLYAMCEYPQVFGGAAGLSTHTPLSAYELINERTDTEVAGKFRDYLVAHLPKKNTHKIYFDYGDQTGDAFYKPYQTKIDDILRRMGYTSSFWVTKEFLGEEHSERSWAKRLQVPVLFLMAK